MACTDRNTKSRHFTHLSEFQRGQIQALYHLGYSLRRIGREIGCTHQTVSNELNRGTVMQIGPNHKRFQAYFAETGQPFMRPTDSTVDAMINWQRPQNLSPMLRKR